MSVHSYWVVESMFVSCQPYVWKANTLYIPVYIDRLFLSLNVHACWTPLACFTWLPINELYADAKSELITIDIILI